MTMPKISATLSRFTVRAGLLLSLLLLSAAPSRAATFSIANGDVAGLKNAIVTANANAEDDTIVLASGGTYNLSMTAPSSAPAVLPAISSDSGHALILSGNGATVQRSAADSFVYRVCA